MSQRGGEPSAATGLSPKTVEENAHFIMELKKYHLQLQWVKDSGGKCTLYYGAQEVPLTATVGV